jgi:glycosyltransferase involved in cell wall biosynthesis
VRRVLGLKEGQRRTPGRRRVLFFGTYDATVYQRIAVLEEGFRVHGDEVVVCNEPLRLPTNERVKMLRKPWKAYKLVFALLRCWLKLIWRARSTGHVDVIVVGYLGLFDVHLARLLWPRVPIVLDHLAPAAEAAIDRRCKSRLLVRALRLVDWAATRAADVVCVDSREHLALAGRRGGVVAPVGAPGSWFTKPHRHDSRPLSVIFFGSFTPLQGAPIVGEAAKLLQDEDIAFTIVGRGQDWAATREAAGGAANVTWIDWIDTESLPRTVASHDICLGIFGTGPKALSVVPTKVFQGAAAGAAIVTSATGPQEEAFHGAAVFVQPGDPTALATTLATLARDRDRVNDLREAAFARAVAEFQPGSIVAALAARLPSSEPKVAEALLRARAA